MSEEEFSKLTWRDLRVFTKSLTEKELDQVVNIQRIDDESWSDIDSIETFDEDYVSIDEEPSIPVSEFKPEEWDGKKLSELPHVICKKGTIIIWTI